jgi:hypothetical protein
MYETILILNEADQIAFFGFVARRASQITKRPQAKWSLYLFSGELEEKKAFGNGVLLSHDE